MTYDQDKDPAYKMMQYVTAVMMSAVLLLWAYMAYVIVFEMPSRPDVGKDRQKYGSESALVNRSNECQRRLDMAGASSVAIFVCYIAIFIMSARYHKRTYPDHRPGWR